MALFGEVGYRITDRWQVTVGARWFDYDDELSNVTSFPFFDFTTAAKDKTGDDGFIFKFNTSYEFTDEVMGYLTVSEGYRVGGTNLGPPCPNPLPPNQTFCLSPDEVLIEPDTTTNYEVGLRSLWLDGRWLVNAALYLIDWEDIQLLGVSDVGTVPITVNGDTAESMGLELTTRLSVTDNLELAASLTLNDAQLTEDEVIGGVDARDGDRLPGSPEQQGTFLAIYTLPLANGWDFKADYSFTAVGDVYTQVGGPRTGGESLPGWTVHGASIGVANGPWSARLYADNLFDKYAVTSVRRDPSYIRQIDRVGLSSIPSRTYFQSMLRPRTVGLEFTWRFDD
jgi:outer membrane receptor protein involved in Fe transport